jgi:hypothetical protein
LRHRFGGFNHQLKLAALNPNLGGTLVKLDDLANSPEAIGFNHSPLEHLAYHRSTPAGIPVA